MNWITVFGLVFLLAFSLPFFYWLWSEITNLDHLERY